MMSLHWSKVLFFVGLLFKKRFRSSWCPCTQAKCCSLLDCCLRNVSGLHDVLALKQSVVFKVGCLKVWLEEKERTKSEVKQSPTPPPPVPEQPAVPVKIGSRYGLQTRAEVAALKAEEEDAKNKKGKGRKTPRPGTRSPRRSAMGSRTATPEVKDKGELVTLLK